jgi:hypothetical protein
MLPYISIHRFIYVQFNALTIFAKSIKIILPTRKYRAGTGMTKKKFLLQNELHKKKLVTIPHIFSKFMHREHCCFETKQRQPRETQKT